MDTISTHGVFRIGREPLKHHLHKRVISRPVIDIQEEVSRGQNKTDAVIVFFFGGFLSLRFCHPCTPIRFVRACSASACSDWNLGAFAFTGTVVPTYPDFLVFQGFHGGAPPVVFIFHHSFLKGLVIFPSSLYGQPESCFSVFSSSYVTER